MNNFDAVLNVIVRSTLCLFLCLISGALAYSGGDGTADSPYQIADANDWLLLTNDPNNWNKQFILTADIDLADVNLTPVGNSTTRFTGIFDGNDHVIRNANINMPSSNSVGLFGSLWWYGQIKNLGVEDVNMNGVAKVGGLVGDNYGIIYSCYATGAVSGVTDIGGLVGENRNEINFSNAACSVAGTGNYVGGLTGANFDKVFFSYATGTVSGMGTYTGGLTGYSYGISSRIVNCHATGDVTGLNNVGGLVGNNYSGEISSSYATGSVEGDIYVGGLVGINGGRIPFCYATGLVSGSEEVGGLAGDNRGTISSCFWDIETSGQIASAGGTGKTTAQMQTLSTFTSAGWDFVGESANGLNDYWQMDVDGYPYFALQSWTLTGEGTSADPYMVTNSEDLGKVWLRPDAHYRLGTNIDLTGISWSSAVVPQFSGVFDGRGFVISNLTINTGGNFNGLFAVIESSGHVCDLGVEDVNVKGGYYISGLAGFCHGTVTSCYTTGLVYGNDYTGGFVAGNGGELTNNYSTCSVRGGWDVGGLTGWNSPNGTIAYCYSTGSVTGGMYYVGGLLGDNAAGSISASFWDAQTSGKIISDGGTGKTTAQMKSISTFASAGWDFYGETANGTEDIWKMCIGGDGYPKLSWEEGTPFTYYIDLAGFQQLGQDAYFFKAYDAATQALLTQIRYGQQIQIKYMVKNLGTRRAGQFTVSFYLSNDSIIGDGDDYKLSASDFYSAGLAAGAYQTKTSAVLTLPSSPPAGYTAATTIYLGMKVDSQNTVVEPNEANNYNTGVGIDKRALTVRTVNLTGYVKTSGGSAVPGVTVTVSGGPKTTTNTSGYYALKVPYNWTGRITPTKTGYSFVPAYLSYTSITASKTSQNFTAYIRPTISGCIKSTNGTVLSGVTITASSGGGVTTTNTSGYYALKVPYNWTGKITPTKTGRTFTPTSRSYTAVTASKTSQNFSSP